MREFLEFLNRLGRGYAEFNDRVVAWSEMMRPAVESFLEGARRAGDALSDWLVVQAVTFHRGGWSEVPLRDMALSEAWPLVERLWEKPDEEVRRELDVAIPAYFRREDYAALRELVESWQPRFGDRHRIFEDALWAHRHGRYTLSIPALAAQVEGIVRDLVGDRKEGMGWRAKFLDALGHDRQSPPLPSRTDDLGAFLEMPAYERFKNVGEVSRYFTLVRVQELFDRVDFSDPRSSSVVNRNVILHGVFESYGETESLKLFFVLDLVHQTAGMYEEGGLENETQPSRLLTTPTSADDVLGSGWVDENRSE